MASQYGTTRVYTTKDEATSTKLKACPLCKVNTQPRHIASTRKETPNTPVISGKTHCPNCGHVYGQNKTTPAY